MPHQIGCRTHLGIQWNEHIDIWSADYRTAVSCSSSPLAKRAGLSSLDVADNIRLTVQNQVGKDAAG